MFGKIIKTFFKVIGRILAYILLIIFIFVSAAGVSAALFAYNKLEKLKPEMDAAVAQIETDPFEDTAPTTLYYWNKDIDYWDVLETLYTEEKRTWLSFDELPDDLVNAAVAIEDKTFWKHHGINWRRTFEATFNYVVRHRKETAGGSTITQQVIKNLTGNWTVNASRKITEIFEAMAFERAHSKEEIIELYLNNIYLGSNCYGVYSAAHKYFNKSVDELTLVECACLVSITNNPSYYDPYRFPEHVKYRAALVIHEMSDQGYISQTDEMRALEEIGYKVTLDENNKATFTYEETLDSFVFKDGSPTYSIVTEDSNHIYSWYVDAVLSSVVDDLMEYYDCTKEEANVKLYNGGLNIYTAYDEDIQKSIEKVYYADDFLVDNTSDTSDVPPNSACVVLKNDTNACVAMIGGTEEKTTNRAFNRATDMQRQPGSSIKPLSVYAPALEEGLITEYSYVMDSPFNTDEDGNPWPVNAYGNYSGNMSIYEAVLHSSNTVAVKVLDELGIDNSYNWLTNKFMISSLTKDDLDYPCLALGGLTNGVSVYEMAGAFSVFARDGVYTAPYLYYKIDDIHGDNLITNGQDSNQIISSDTLEQMDDMLYNNTLYGTAYNSDVNGVRCAGKTGTTTNDLDVWFCGYTKEFTCAVWTGYDDNQELWNSYPNPSCQTWHDIIERIATKDRDLEDNN